MSTAHRPDRAAEQLALLAVADVPIQFRLPDRTRRMGLANIASIKALLAEQEARRAERSHRIRESGVHPAREAA